MPQNHIFGHRQTGILSGSKRVWNIVGLDHINTAHTVRLEKKMVPNCPIGFRGRQRHPASTSPLHTRQSSTVRALPLALVDVYHSTLKLDSLSYKRSSLWRRINSTSCTVARSKTSRAAPTLSTGLSSTSMAMPGPGAQQNNTTTCSVKNERQRTNF